MNKTLLRLAGLMFVFGVFELLVILYWLITVSSVQGLRGVDDYGFAIIMFPFGISAMVLFVLSLATLAFYKWYKGNISVIVKSIIIILTIIIFILPHILFILIRDGTMIYGEYQNISRRNEEKQKIERQKDKELACLEYKLYMSQRKKDDPMPTYDPEAEGCNLK